MNHRDLTVFALYIFFMVNRKKKIIYKRELVSTFAAMPMV